MSLHEILNKVGYRLIIIIIIIIIITNSLSYHHFMTKD